MPGYVIFLPHKTGQDPRYLTDVGLGDLLADGAPEFLQVDSGPGGNPGVLARWSSPEYPDRAPTWSIEHHTFTPFGSNLRATPHVETAADLAEVDFWLGHEKGKPPRPEDLERRRLRAGPRVRLADGQEWQIPVAQMLPRVLGLGKPRPTDAYRPFWALTMRAVEEWLQLGEGGPFWRCADDQLFAFACAALAINYRVSPVVCDWLGLIDTDCAFDVLNAVTEGTALGRLLDLEKKRAECLTAATLSTEPGEPA